MTRRSKTTKASSLLSELHVPLLILGAFFLGAGGMWLIMRSSAPGRPGPRPVERFSPSPATEPPDVSQLAPADAAKILGDWNYDRHDWAHAIDHYQEAIADGADNPDVRTDLGNCFRFIGESHRALEQYQIAQTENPMHENSLFNQAGLYAEVLHDDQRALATAREFLKRFPQGDRAAAARQLISKLEGRDQSAGKP
ncbi:MAG TPA: tetratricopeptide repeat protein [Candidatus Udaeobacter sp.]|jgi:tetratricopeptide (TPR) repeat protein